jgi:hypothetical protein
MDFTKGLLGRAFTLRIRTGFDGRFRGLGKEGLLLRRRFSS